VPLLFAVTLFVSASLLFMVQPMVGKLVLPLLGGSPAVWNACMVFFQALLLLGYLYADRLTRQESPRKQWYIHMCVLALPIAAFALAIALSARHTPISAAESLSPTEGSSAILSVLAILTVAIGVPFFVVSTSATLLQKWFTYTGHPSARDPYFLYAASNFGSLIALLGYPIFIEPNLTQGGQTWFWAAGFVALVGLIAFCGRAAVNPLGVPPLSGLAGGKGQQFTGQQAGSQKAAGKPAAAPAPAATAPPADAIEAAPSWARMAKWTALAFVPSSLMLGVTFHMTTDIASIPLLWVGPLALYLVTFIIAFGHPPPWFRILIGNLAPVMILLLVFVMIAADSVKPGVGVELLLYNLTFFAAALMCHYELARDRPSPHYLTTYFLIMSFGGVLGGIFNSLVAPLIFSLSYEFPLVLVIACLMVPQLSPAEPDEKDPNAPGSAPAPNSAAEAKKYRGLSAVLWCFQQIGRNRRLALALDIVIPVVVGLAFWQLQKMPGHFEWYRKMLGNVAEALPFKVGYNVVYSIITFALPVMVCFFFVDRPLRFALAVAAILGPVKINSESSDTIYTERSFFGILKIQETFQRQYLLERTKYKLTDQVLEDLRKNKLPESVLSKLNPLLNQDFRGDGFERELARVLDAEERQQYGPLILRETARQVEEPDAVRDADNKPIVLGQYHFHKLVHGTTLHGTQVWKHDRHVLDDFQLLTAGNVWDNLAVAGAQMKFDARDEPLTYYHRTGPVGAMFAELTRRGKEKEPVAMVGLGTGSVSCYAQKGQKLTFYEIDPAVKRLVADTARFFTYVSLARERGAELDFRMGDARLKLKEDTDRKYALLLVDAFSSDAIPVHLLTVEAVGLYLDRLTDDGILALHISNKFVKLEPVVAAIAEHHKLVARVWNDDSERGPGTFGKTSSSWVALARRPEDLGDRLCSPIGNWISRYGENEQILEVIKDLYPDVLQKPLPKWDPKNPKDPKEPEKPREPDKDQRTLILEYLDRRGATDPQAQELARWVRLRNSEYTTLMGVLHTETGYGFRPVRRLKDVDAWTDDYADVMRVMMIEQLQAVRKFFGLPTPVEG
jgi:spermidine synthase